MKRSNLPGRKGKEQLACAVCGYRFNKPWMVLWLMKAHMEIWHGTEEVHLITVDPNTRPDVPEPIDMGEAEDITRLLKQLHDVNEETKQVIVEARTALKDLKHGVREAQADIRAAIAEEVGKAADAMELEARERLNTRIDEIAEDISRRLSQRLSL